MLPDLEELTEKSKQIFVQILASAPDDQQRIETLGRFLTDLSGGEDKVGTREGRLAVAMAFGYLDARFMVYMMETHGLPLSIQAMKAKENGLKTDLNGLRWELEKIGKKPDTIESELKEVRFFCDHNEIKEAAFKEEDNG